MAKMAKYLVGWKFRVFSNLEPFFPAVWWNINFCWQKIQPNQISNNATKFVFLLIKNIKKWFFYVLLFHTETKNVFIFLEMFLILIPLNFANLRINLQIYSKNWKRVLTTSKINWLRIRVEFKLLYTQSWQGNEWVHISIKKCK